MESQYFKTKDTCIKVTVQIKGLKSAISDCLSWLNFLATSFAVGGIVCIISGTPDLTLVSLSFFRPGFLRDKLDPCQ